MSCGCVLCRFTVILVCYYSALNFFMDLDFNTTVHLSLIMLCSQTECVRGVGGDIKHRSHSPGVDTHALTHIHTHCGVVTHTAHTREWVVFHRNPARVGEKGMKNVALPSALVLHLTTYLCRATDISQLLTFATCRRHRKCQISSLWGWWEEY